MDTGDPSDLALLDNSLWVQEDIYVFTAFLFQNPTSDLLFEDVEYTVYLHDAGGNEIANDTSTVRWIFPGQTFGIVFDFYLADENILVDSVSVEWEYDTAPANGFANPFTISNPIFWENGDYPIVTGVINNNNPDTYTDVNANIICYDSAGEIVGGGTTNIVFVPGDDYMGFASYIDAFDSVASVEVFPTFSFNSVTYEGSDFWSEISILDDNFYSTTYGSLIGGFEVQNNLDTTLTDSVANVTFYDKDENVTSMAEFYIDLLLPHQTLGISPWALTPADEAKTDSYDIWILPGEYEPDYELSENPFVRQQHHAHRRLR